MNITPSSALTSRRSKSVNKQNDVVSHLSQHVRCELVRNVSYCFTLTMRPELVSYYRPCRMVFRWLSRNVGRSPLSKQILIRLLAVELVGYVQALRSQIVFIVLSNAL